MTVEDISARAGVSRRTFYENFRDKEDCFMTSYRQHAQELLAVVAGAASAGEHWEERARFAVAALLRFFAQRPDYAHMGVIEVMAAGPAAVAERDQALTAVASLLGDEALAMAPDPAPRMLLRTVAGGGLQLIYAWVLAGRTSELERLLPTIMYMILAAPYGPAGAAERAGLVPERAGPR
jgi:AcrR family transcriptional regulator